MMIHLHFVGLLIIQCSKEMLLPIIVGFSHNPFSMPQGEIE